MGTWNRSPVFLGSEEYAAEEQGPLSLLLVRRSNRAIGDHDDCCEGLLLKRVDGAEHSYKKIVKMYSGIDCACNTSQPNHNVNDIETLASVEVK